MQHRFLALMGYASLLGLGCGDDTTVDTGSTPASTGPTANPATEGGETSEPSTGTQTSNGSGEGSTTAPPTLTTGVDSSTGPAPACGNEMIDADEVCDGTELSGEDCNSQGFDAGELACDADCTGFDTNNCMMANCGNGFAEGAELCDGNDLAGATCESEGFDNGTLGCTLTCRAFDTSGCGTCGNVVVDGTEVCDDVALFGETCMSQGFDSGQLGCLPDCLGYDTAPCGLCGNLLIDGAEFCDSDQIGGETCESQGFDSGTLSCLPSCSAFDTEGCGTCGNDLTDGDEFCDGIDTGAETCLTQGFDSGALSCQPDCGAYDTSTCGTCPNGVVDGTEACDGIDLDGESCGSLGLGGGTLACGGSCQYDFSDCDVPGGVLVSVRTSDDVLIAIDTITLAVVDIGPLGVAYDFGEVAYDSTTGTLWMIDGRPLEALYTIDVASGAANLVGVHGIEDLFGLAHDPTTATLYGSGESPTGFYSMNQATGAASFIGDPAMAADGLTYDPLRDQIVALEGGGGDLFTIDRVTAAVNILSSEGGINNCGLAYDPILDLYWAIDWTGNFYSYDPNNGYTRTLELSGLTAHDGLTFVPGIVVP